MAKAVATLLGIVFILVGLVGFAAPNLLGGHFNTAHNVIHLVSGAAALYFGLAGSMSGAKVFGIVFGAVYLLLGLAGFFAGGDHDRMLALIPGTLEFGTTDHIIHVLMGGIFLVGGLLTKTETAASST